MMQSTPAFSEPPGPVRCRQPDVTLERLNAEISRYEEYLEGLPPYLPALRSWIARYSRGDTVAVLRDEFGKVAEHVERYGKGAQERSGKGGLLFTYGPGSLGVYRDALVLLSIACCLRLRDATRTVVRWCERGDALIETFAQAEGAQQGVAPPFPEEFDGLYAALGASTETAAADLVRQYLGVWLHERMDEMGFKIAEEGLGYWCFEAAGVVAALDLDDSSFADDPLYPRDLVASYREGR
jgi:Domain of unknown function (DUF1911)